MHEGNLEPPKRHPIDWRNPDFYNVPRKYKVTITGCRA